MASTQLRRLARYSPNPAFNRVVLRIFYFPVAVVAVVVFTVVNVALTPFAYIYALIHKVLILFRVPSGSAFLEVLIYLVFGLLFHALNIHRL